MAALSDTEWLTFRLRQNAFGPDIALAYYHR